MKFANSFSVHVLAVAFTAMMLLSACSKEELVSPCGSEPDPANTERTVVAGDDGSTLNLADGDTFGRDPNSGTGLTSRSMDAGEEDPGGGISDDGDDDGDKERKQKKIRN